MKPPAIAATGVDDTAQPVPRQPMQQTPMRRNPVPFGAMSDFGYRAVLIIGGKAATGPARPHPRRRHYDLGIRCRSRCSTAVQRTAGSGRRDVGLRRRREQDREVLLRRDPTLPSVCPSSGPRVSVTQMQSARALSRHGHLSILATQCSTRVHQRTACAASGGTDQQFFFAHRWLATKSLHLLLICLLASYSNVILPISDRSASDVRT